MKVKILVTARYADFETHPGQVKARQRVAGDEVEYQAEYARQIIKSGLAEAVQPPQSARADTSLGTPKGDASYPVGDSASRPVGDTVQEEPPVEPPPTPKPPTARKRR